MEHTRQTQRLRETVTLDSKLFDYQMMARSAPFSVLTASLCIYYRMWMQVSKEMANRCAEQYNAMLEVGLTLADIESEKEKLMAIQQSQVREFMDMNKQAL